MTRLILIRHAQTVDNVKGLMQGKYNDSELSVKGRSQVTDLLHALDHRKIDAVFTSDLGRAIKTAEPIARVKNLTVRAVPELRESDIGDWRGLPVKESIEKWINYYDQQKKLGVPREVIRAPNGENTWDHLARIKIALSRIIEEFPSETVVIVAHAGTNKVLLGYLEGRDPDAFYDIQQNNACINEVIVSDTETKVLSVNDLSHLHEEA